MHFIGVLKKYILNERMCGMDSFLIKVSSVSATNGRLTLWYWPSAAMAQVQYSSDVNQVNPYPTAFPYAIGMVLHFYEQRESSTTKTVHKVINKGLKSYV